MIAPFQKSATAWGDIEGAIEDMLGAGGRLSARMLGADSAIGFAAMT